MSRFIVIIGLGALGSHVALFLRNSTEWSKLKLVDFDKVEAKNTAAQFHTTMSLRRNKATALGQALYSLFGVKVDVVPHKLTRDNAEKLLWAADIVIDCTDNIAARQVIQAEVRDKGIPCIHGALSGDATFGRIVWDEDFVADAEGADGEATCEDGEALPFFGLAASLLASTAQEFLRSGKKRSFQLTPTSVTRI